MGMDVQICCTYNFDLVKKTIKSDDLIKTF